MPVCMGGGTKRQDREGLDRVCSMEYAGCIILSIKEESTVEALARAFCSNGRKQEQAMLDVKYSATYARKYCGLLWANPRLKAAIARIDAVQAQIGCRTVKNLDSMYQQGFDVAKTQNNPTGMATNTTGIARLYNMDQSASSEKAPDALTSQETEKLRQMAKQLTKPTLSKETA